MKRIIVIALLALFLSGCSSRSELNEVMEFRDRILKSEGYAFCAHITADYGDAVYIFSMNCTFSESGDMTFTVVSPESLNGITGTVSSEQGTLTFDNEVLLFALLAEDQLTPISAPWLTSKALRSGYIQSCGIDGENIKVILDDSYAANALQVEIWFSKDMIPVAADISWQNRRILTIEIGSFSYV